MRKNIYGVIGLFGMCAVLWACTSTLEANVTTDCSDRALAALPVPEPSLYENHPLGACLIAQMPEGAAGARIACEDLMRLDECTLKMQAADTGCTAMQFYETYTCYKYQDIINDPPLEDVTVE